MSGVREEFYSLPAYVRAKFGHDPMNFINHLNDPAVLEYLQQQGLYSIHDTSFDEPQQSVSNKQTQEKSNTLEQNNEETQK